MRLAVLSDIHGNLIALEAVLADIGSFSPDLTWCLGDLAAFGPRPAECIRRIRALSEADEGKRFKVIGGNTDRYLVTGERFKTPPAPDADAFQKLAGAWSARDTQLNWAVQQLTFDDYEFLKKLIGRELHHRADGCAVIGYHAVPGDDEPMLTADTPDEEARDWLLDREGHLGVGGHIHRQYDRDLGDWRIVNVGSVGLSFDAPGYAQWGLFTIEHGRVEVDLRRVPYDVDAAIADAQAAAYPAAQSLVARLRGA